MSLLVNNSNVFSNQEGILKCIFNEPYVFMPLSREFATPAMIATRHALAGVGHPDRLITNVFYEMAMIDRSLPFGTCLVAIEIDLQNTKRHRMAIPVSNRNCIKANTWVRNCILNCFTDRL
jgi:hypothetical protein